MILIPKITSLIVWFYCGILSNFFENLLCDSFNRLNRQMKQANLFKSLNIQLSGNFCLSRGRDAMSLPIPVIMKWPQSSVGKSAKSQLQVYMRPKAVRHDKASQATLVILATFFIYSSNKIIFSYIPNKNLTNSFLQPAAFKH